MISSEHGKIASFLADKSSIRRDELLFSKLGDVGINNEPARLWGGSSSMVRDIKPGYPQPLYRDVGPKIEYLEPRELPAMHANGVRTVYVLKEKVIEHHHTGWGFSAFNEFMNKALATFAFVCIGGVALAMLIMAFAVVSRL